MVLKIMCGLSKNYFNDAWVIFKKESKNCDWGSNLNCSSKREQDASKWFSEILPVHDFYWNH